MRLKKGIEKIDISYPFVDFVLIYALYSLTAGPGLLNAILLSCFLARLKKAVKLFKGSRSEDITKYHYYYRLHTSNVMRNTHFYYVPHILS